MSRYRGLFVLLVIAAILASCETEAKRRGRRKRPRLPTLFRGRSTRTRNRYEQYDESKRVYYYSLPKTPKRPPRIILGDELNFSSMGIHQNPKKSPKSFAREPVYSPSTSSLSALEQQYGYYDNIDDRPVPHPPLPFHDEAAHAPPAYPREAPYPLRRPKKLIRQARGRGPGYRLEHGGNWRDHYVLEQEYKPHKHRNHLAVMPYLKNAGKNLFGAYRAAIINSAQIAHFTGHAASKYIKGVRNLMGPRSDKHIDTVEQPENKLQASSSNDNTLVLKPEQPPTSPSGTDQAEEVVEIDLTNASSDAEQAPSSGVPKVYLDWGGDFWRLLGFKRSQMTAAKKIT